MNHPRLTAAIALLLALALRAQEADEFAKKFGRGVVTVRTSMDVCSGTVIDQSGLLLTSANLVVTPLVIEVIAQTEDGKFHVYDQIEVVGVHKQHALALLRIVNADPPLHPLVLAAPGSRPAAGEWRMLVRKLNQRFEPQPAEVVTGAIHRVQSVGDNDIIELSGLGLLMEAGGALCDQEGRVLGIHKVDFAGEKPRLVVPVEQLAAEHFVGLDQRRRDPQSAMALAKEARALIDNALAGEPNAQAQRAIAEGFLAAVRALVHDPTSFQAHFQAGRACLLLSDAPAGRAFLEKAVQIDSADVAAHKVLADLAMAEHRDVDAAHHWRAALTGAIEDRAEVRGDAAYCALFLAADLTDSSPLGAAYLLRWSIALSAFADQANTRVMREELRVKVVSGLDASELARLEEHCKRGFSLEILGTLIGTKKAPAITKVEGLPAAEARLAALVARAQEKVEIPQMPPESGIVIDLPGGASWIAPALGGARVIVKVQQPPQLVEIDLVSASILQTIELQSATALVATGAEKLAIIDPTANTLRVIDLLTKKEERARKLKLPRGARPLALAMGSLVGERAFFTWDYPPEAKLPAGAGILDLSDGKIQEVKLFEGALEFGSFADRLIEANLDLTRILLNEESSSSGVLMELDSTSRRPAITKASRIQASMRGRFSTDGQTIVDLPGVILAPDPHLYSGTFLYPFVDAPMALSCGNNGAADLQLRSLNDMKVLGHLRLELRNSLLPLVACATISRAAWVEAQKRVRIIALNWEPVPAAVK